MDGMQAVSGALLHARYAVEWQASGYFVDGIESQGLGLHVVCVRTPLFLSNSRMHSLRAPFCKLKH